MPHNFKRLASLFGLWTLGGLICAGAQYIFLIEENRQFSGSRPPPAALPIVAWVLVAFYLWAALSPLIARFAHRFPVEGGRRWRNLVLHLPAAAFFILAEISLWTVLRWVVHQPPLKNFRSPLELFWTVLMSWLIIDLMIYVIVLVVIHALKYHREFVGERLKASEMRAHLAGVELQALKSQLHPHFLFNTINAVSELVYDSPQTADRILTQLSALLRTSLKGGKENEISLVKELDFLRGYVEIQQTLLQERLAVDFRIDSGALGANVPNMILQPLVENAIRYAVAPREEGGKVKIEARRYNGSLRVRVCDDGPGLAADNSDREETKGIGLANTRARLRHLYGDAHSFELTETPGGGLTVSMEIPFRENGGGARGEHAHEKVSRADRR